MAENTPTAVDASQDTESSEIKIEDGKYDVKCNVSFFESGGRFDQDEQPKMRYLVEVGDATSGDIELSPMDPISQIAIVTGDRVTRIVPWVDKDDDGVSPHIQKLDSFLYMNEDLIGDSFKPIAEEDK